MGIDFTGETEDGLSFLLGGSASLFKRGLFRGGTRENSGGNVLPCTLAKYLLLYFGRSSTVCIAEEWKKI